MFKTKNVLLIVVVMVLSLFVTNNAFAVSEEDVIAIFGEDLTVQQHQSLLEEMEIENPDEVETVYVKNEEEHKFLGDFVPAEKIGSRALSSAKLITKEPGYGLTVETNKINYITSEMYQNALSTSGVTDIQVYVTAPFDVSGTGALTGIMKAFEVSSGEVIDDDLKKAANQEMVLTAELAEDENIGDEDAVDLVNNIKEKIELEDPQTEEELRDLIKRLAEEMGITLTEEQLQSLVDLFDTLRNLDIDWSKVNDTISNAKDKVVDFINSEEGSSFIDEVKKFFNSLWNAIKSFFS